MVDIVGPDQLAHKALQQVVAFVGELGAANAADRVRPCLPLDRLQPLRHHTQRLAPRGRLQLAVAPHQRHRQPLCVVDPAVAEAALVADPLVVDLHVFAADNATQRVRARVKAHVAADGALRADRRRALNLPGAEGKARHAVGQRTHRAEVDDVAARLGIHRLAVLNVDDRRPAALKERQLRAVLPLLQVADAAPAEHAALLVEHDGIRDHVVLFLLPLGFDQLADAGAKAHGLVLQGALTALVADGAIQRVVEQQKGQVRLLHILHRLRVGLDHHIRGHRHRAGRLQHHPTRAGDFHQAHAAAGHRVELGVAAKDGDLDVQLGGGIHHQRALGHLDLAVVDRQCDKVGHKRIGP